MMDGVREWLLTLIALCLLCALADALMPRGPVKGAGRLVCGLALLCALLTPLPGLRLEEGQVWLEDYFRSLEEQEQALEEQVSQGTKGIIEEKYAAYIVDKANQEGIGCTVRVTCAEGEGGLTVPVQVELAGSFTDQEQSRLTQIITEELQVPVDRQIYYSGEELP